MVKQMTYTKQDVLNEMKKLGLPHSRWTYLDLEKRKIIPTFRAGKQGLRRVYTEEQFHQIMIEIKDYYFGNVRFGGEAGG